MIIRFFLLLFVLCSSAFAVSDQRFSGINLKRLSFGSCNWQSKPQPLWKDILKQNPDLWIWGGDVVYADWDNSEGLEGLRQAYEVQYKNPEFQALRSKIPMTGVWDDHDFGGDNMEGENPFKKESQRMILEFFKEPAESPRWTQEGLYISYDLLSDGRKVKIFIIDNRYFKKVEQSAPMIGEVQWRWLEEEIKTSNADLNIFVSGLSVWSPILRYTEEWADWPTEKTRLSALIKKYNPKARLWLTGDKHFGSIFQNQGELEFLSSGMTHVVDRRTWYYLGRVYGRAYFGLNYGQVDISWDGNNPILSMSIRNQDGRDVFPTKFRWEPSGWKEFR